MDKNYQLIFCVEANDKSMTDALYISELLKRFFPIPTQLSTQVKIQYVYLGSKYKYKQPKIKREIEAYKKHFSGETYVIYVADTDEFDHVVRDKQFVDELSAYCLDEEHHLIWFVKDIENVLLGTRIENTRKKREAVKFKSSGSVSTINPTILSSKDLNKVGTSNFLVVLNPIFNHFELRNIR